MQASLLARLPTTTLIKMAIGAKLKELFIPKLPGGFGSWFVGQPRTDYNYRADLGDGLGCSVIMPVVQWLERAFCEAPLIVQQQKQDEWETIPAHALTQLISRPNDFYGASQLWMATIADWCWFGEAYWRVLRQRGGQPGELWWLPPWTIDPKWPTDGSVYISHYTYTAIDRGNPIDLDLDEVVHFRHGLDPRNPRHGMPPLRAVLRDVWSDEEASNWVGSLLRNMGVPGMIISPKGENAFLSPEEMDRVKAYISSRFTGDSRGEPLAFGTPTDVSKLAFSPKEFDMGVVRDTAEERVSAALGVPAAVVGFGTGLEQSKVGATMREMVQLAWSNGVLPIKRIMADELFRTLMPAFEESPNGFRVSWDLGEVKALQEDENEKAKRVIALVTGGIWKVSEGRRETGMEADAEDEIYLRPTSLTAVDPKDQMPEPEPMPLALPAGNPPPANGNGNGNGNGARNGAGAVQQRAFLKQGTMADIIQGIIARHAQTMDKPPRKLLRLAAKLWRQEQALQPKFHAMLLPVLKRYGEIAGTAAREILIQKAVPQDVINMAIIHERLPFIQIQAELAQVYEQMYEIMTGLTLELMTEALNLEPVNPARIQNQLRMLAQDRVGLLDLPGDARERILLSLDEARVQGLTEDQMIELIKNKVPSGRWTSPEVRSQILVRSETRFASNVATTEYARAAGIDKVLILDARLGPTDQECEMRNGWVVSPSEGRMLSSIEHPNGTLAILPLAGNVSGVTA